MLSISLFTERSKISMSMAQVVTPRVTLDDERDISYHPDLDIRGEVSWSSTYNIGDMLVHD